MASDETLHEDEQEFDVDDDHQQFQQQLQHQQAHNLSRLSVCTSSTACEDCYYYADDVDNQLVSMTSRLSIESLEGEAGGELSDSESEAGKCYSLPSTPPRRRRSRSSHRVKKKEYASDNEGGKRRRRMRKKEEEVMSEGFSGESDQSGVVVITRPKGGKRSLCMGLDEVKACIDLGFELEHQRMFSPSLSFSNSASGTNSPIANWRISSPGDDPRDVKARLKVWAQAVALASATKRGTTTPFSP